MKLVGISTMSFMNLKSSVSCTWLVCFPGIPSAMPPAYSWNYSCSGICWSRILQNIAEPFQFSFLLGRCKDIPKHSIPGLVWQVCSGLRLWSPCCWFWGSSGENQPYCCLSSQWFHKRFDEMSTSRCFDCVFIASLWPFRLYRSGLVTRPYQVNSRKRRDVTTWRVAKRRYQGVENKPLICNTV